MPNTRLSRAAHESRLGSGAGGAESFSGRPGSLAAMPHGPSVHGASSLSNSVAVIDRTSQGKRPFVIAAGSHPVHRELEARGFEVHATALDEFERADGSPTCLSLLVEALPSLPDPPGPDGGNLRR